MPRITLRNGTQTAYRLDAGTRTRLHWLEHFAREYLGAADLTHSTIIRRAVALYVDHAEGLMDTGNPDDLLHTVEKYRIAEANAGRPLGVTPEQACVLPVAPLSDVRKAIHKRAPAVLEAMQREREQTRAAVDGSAYIATAIGK